MRRLLLAGLVLVGLAVPAVAAPQPSPTPGQEPEDPVRVVISDILPRAPQPGGAVEVKGVLRNTGSRPVSNLRVRLQVGDVVTTRGELDDADGDRPPTSYRVGVTVAPALAPGASAAFDVRTDVATLGLRQVGVYPLDVVARGDAGDGTDSLGLAPTWLPYFDGTTPRPSRVAVLWPLVDGPHARPDGTLGDDELAGSLAPTGRLGRMLAAAKGALTPECELAALGPTGTPGARPTRCLPVPVTYAVDPDLLETVRTMASPYRVRGADRKLHDGSGTAAASAWFSQLRLAPLAGRVLSLPYGDPDVSALARNLRGQDDVSTAAALGAQVTQAVLDVPTVSGVAWPPAGPVTPTAANALSVSGARTFVLDGSAFDETPERGRKPGAQTPFTTSATGADLTGLVVDPDLSGLLGTGSEYGARVAEQRFLAESAVVAAEAPGLTRTFVLAPPRRASVDVTAATAELRDLGRLPWLCPVDLAAVVSGTARCAGLTEGRVPDEVSRGPARTDGDGELSQAFLSRVAADRDVAVQLTDAVLTPDQGSRDDVAQLKGRLRRAVARAQSSEGRDDARRAQRAAAWLHETVAGLRDGVVVRGGHALLTSSKGTLSVSLENTLDVPVQVRVRFTSKTATLSDAETGLVTVRPGHAVQASVRAQAQRSGQFVVFARVIDRNGKPFGSETELIVRSTRFGRLALAVTVAAAAVLFFAAGVRITRRALRRPRDGQQP